jgi:hypothetical protein
MFFLNTASIEGTGNSMEQKTRVFVKLMFKNSVSGLKQNSSLFRWLILYSSAAKLLYDDAGFLLLFH